VEYCGVKFRLLLLKGTHLKFWATKLIITKLEKIVGQELANSVVTVGEKLRNLMTMTIISTIIIKSVKGALQEAVEVHRAVRRQCSHVSYKIVSQNAMRF
jgi:hypothetical protein